MRLLNHTIDLVDSKSVEFSAAEVRRMIKRMFKDLKEDLQKQLNESQENANKKLEMTQIQLNRLKQTSE
jgi:hypothetical protein